VALATNTVSALSLFVSIFLVYLQDLTFQFLRKNLSLVFHDVDKRTEKTKSDLMFLVTLLSVSYGDFVLFY